MINSISKHFPLTLDCGQLKGAMQILECFPAGMCHHHAEFHFRRALEHDTIQPESLPQNNKDAPVSRALLISIRGLIGVALSIHISASILITVTSKRSRPFSAALHSQALASISLQSHSIYSNLGFSRPAPLTPSSLSLLITPFQSFFWICTFTGLRYQPHSRFGFQASSILCCYSRYHRLGNLS